MSREGHITECGRYFKEDAGYALFLRIDRDAFESRQAAEADARKRAELKVKSLEKQIEKMRKLAEAPRFLGG